MLAVSWEPQLAFLISVHHNLLDILVSDIVEVQQVGPTIHQALYQILLSFQNLRVKARVFYRGVQLVQARLYLLFGPYFLLLLYALSDILKREDFLLVCDHIFVTEPLASTIPITIFTFNERPELLPQVEVLGVQESLRRRSHPSLALLASLDYFLISIIIH